MYINRTLKDTIEKLSSFFPAILLTGPRQSGKTTLLKNILGTNVGYVTLDSLSDRELAQKDPELFLQRYKFPLFIDEVQYAPELFPYIKIICDKEQKSGLFYLTGSQQFSLMKNVSESLAGRVGIVQLQGFSQAEKIGLQGKDKTIPFLPTENYLKTKRAISHETNITETYHTIWKGSYPKLFTSDDDFWSVFYDSYLQTYIERDVKQILNIGSTLDFLKFVRILAARTGMMINYADIAKDVGVSLPTIKSWISILESSGLIFILQPYFNNLSKRLIRTPKVYFMDTGLVAFLTGWKTSETLENGAMDGSIFETYVVSEIVKSYWNNGLSPDIFYYRDKDKNEIDILLKQDGLFYPIEIKKKSTPDKDDIKTFSVIEKVLHERVGVGAVICLAKTDIPLTKDVSVIPVSYL